MSTGVLASPTRRGGQPYGARGLSVTANSVGNATVLTLRGEITADNIAVLVSAIDAALRSPAKALVLSGETVTKWAPRGLEVVLHASVLAYERRVLFALSGLPDTERAQLRRQSPGIPAEKFEFDSTADALHYVSGSTDSEAGRSQLWRLRQLLSEGQRIDKARELLMASRRIDEEQALLMLVRSAGGTGRRLVDVAAEVLAAEGRLPAGAMGESDFGSRIPQQRTAPR